MGGNFFYQLGKKVGKSLYRGRYLYKTLTGNVPESLQAEYTLGVLLKKEIEKQTPLSQEPLLLLAAESVLRRLQKQVKNKERYFTVKILSLNELNAFALPGGFMYISETLMTHLRHDPDALAFVIAHEMIHIILKHPLKRMLTSYSLEAISRILKTGSVMGAIGKDVLKKLLRSHYSRENELLADAYGLRLMYSAGFETSGALRLMRLFSTMQKNEGFNYFSTHPALSERLNQLQKLQEKLQHA